MDRIYKKPFEQFVKKQTRPFQARIEDEVEAICKSPVIGELKTGDLADIRIHKFKYLRQGYLIAYQTTAANDIEFFSIAFYKIVTHKNFYTELKKYRLTSR
jgi:hypothetical protein